MPRRHWQLRIADMLDAAETAVRLAKDLDQDTFFSDRMLVDAVIKNIVVLGEAASRAPNEVTENQPDVPWREMRNMRNFIVHEYFGLNQDVLWGTVRDDLPALIPSLRRVLEMGDAGLPDCHRPSREGTQRPPVAFHLPRKPPSCYPVQEPRLTVAPPSCTTDVS